MDEIDVFISYSSKDRPWADRLYRDLKAKGLEVFLDIHDLQAGSIWNAQLTGEMKKSRYFVGLWSRHARESQWVDHEATLFERKLPAAGPGLILINQRLIFILLDEEENVPYGHLETIRDLKEAGVYAGGAGTVDQHDPMLWPRVVEKVYEAVTSDETTMAIPLLILTTTSPQLNALDSTHPPPHLPFAESLDDLLKRIGLAKTDLIPRYGPQRTDWKPFGSPYDIITLLNQDRDRINSLPGPNKFRWKPLGPNFWSRDQQEMRAEIARLERGLAAIVIDPLAFYDGDVFARFNSLQGCLDNQDAVVIVLAPFRIPDSTRALREALEKIAYNIYRDYYEPGVRRMPSARCNVSYGDDLDIRRSLLATLRSYLHQAEPRPAHAYTQV